MNEISFEKIVGFDQQISLLYQLLEKRGVGISHEKMPTFAAHTAFVKNNPYLVWFLVFSDDKAIGSVYLQDDNSIGINLANPDKATVRKVIEFVEMNFKPLPSVLSKIPPYFFVNIPAEDKKMAKILDEIGAKKIQVSYRL